MKLKQLTERQTREWIEVYSKLEDVVLNVTETILNPILSKKEEQYHKERTLTWYRRNFHENRMCKGIKDTNDYSYACLGKVMYGCLSVLYDYKIMFDEDELSVIKTVYRANSLIKEAKVKLVIMNEYASKPFTITEEEVEKFLIIKNALTELYEIQKKYINGVQ